MSLILATGSNIGDRLTNLSTAKRILSAKYKFIAQSNVYTSAAIEYSNQPDFLNQVLEFEIPKLNPRTVMQSILLIEKELGRIRDIPKGPRIIDIDIIFWGLCSIDEKILTVPHPAWDKRSFVVKPLSELPFFSTIQSNFNIPTTFDIEALPFSAAPDSIL